MLAATSAAGSLGLAAGGTAGALLGAELTGTAAAAGLPLGLLVLGSAGSAVVISRRSSRVGRGRSLALGYVLGSAGAGLSVVAVVAGSLPLLLVASVLLGSANAAVFLTRYAAAEAGGEAAAGRRSASPCSRPRWAPWRARCSSAPPGISHLTSACLG